MNARQVINREGIGTGLESVYETGEREIGGERERERERERGYI